MFPADIRECLCGSEYPEFCRLPVLQLGRQGEAGAGPRQAAPTEQYPNFQQKREDQASITDTAETKHTASAGALSTSYLSAPRGMGGVTKRPPNQGRVDAAAEEEEEAGSGPGALGESRPRTPRGRARNNEAKARMQPPPECNAGHGFPRQRPGHSQAP